MADFTGNVFESAVHLPHADTEHLLLGAGVVAAVAVAGAIGRARFDRTQEQYAVDFRGNGALLEASIVGGASESEKARLSPLKKGLAGIALLGLQLAVQPVTEINTPNSNAETVVVTSASSSMVYTHDVSAGSESRLEAAVRGIRLADYPGSMGFIQTAAGSAIISKPVKGWKNATDKLDKPQINTNGADLAPAIEQAAQLLSGKPENRGTVLVVTDGIVSDTADQLSATAAKLKQENVRVKLMVTGTSDGVYRFPGTTQQSKSAVEPQNLKAFGAGNIIEAKDEVSIRKAIAQELKAAGNTSEKHPWQVPGIIGGLLVMAAVAQGGWQRIERKV